MAADLKISVKREIDRLRKELDTATGRVTELLGTPFVHPTCRILPIILQYHCQR